MKVMKIKDIVKTQWAVNIPKKMNLEFWLKISIIIFLSNVWKIVQKRSYFKKLNKGDAKSLIHISKYMESVS